MMNMYSSSSDSSMAAKRRKPMMNAINFGVETMFRRVKDNVTCYHIKVSGNSIRDMPDLFLRPV